MTDFVVFHLPGNALLLSSVLPDVPVATFGGDAWRDRFVDAGLSTPLLMPPDLEILSTIRLLDHPPIADAIAAAAPARLICFKPNARLEARAAELGATLAHAPARVAQGIENKLALPEIAAAAGVPIPAPRKVVPSATTYDELAAELGPDLVVQQPRGHAGETTWRVRDADDWAPLAVRFGKRALRVARFVHGRPGTTNAVVDAHGNVVVSAPILQLTGDPSLTPHALGSCGNDFTWRPSPNPGDAPAAIAEALGPVLADRGYAGHFGIDWVFDGETVWLIEINARLTASFALYGSREPRLLSAHLAAVAGDPITPLLLPPFVGGQLISRNLTDSRQPPRDEGPRWHPHPAASVAPGGRRGTYLVDGPVIDDRGRLSAAIPRHLH